MTLGSLGQLSNAPLAYVLGAINFDSQTSLEADIPELQKLFQENGFPRYKRIKQATIQFSANSADDSPSFTANVQHGFTSINNQLGVILSQDTLVFHATTYTKYPDFDAELTKVLKIVSSKLKYLMVNRVGLRYIDLIIPKAGETPDVYVNENLRCLPQLPFARAKSGLAISELAMEKGSLIVRYLVGYGQQVLPPDFQTLSLAKPEIFKYLSDSQLSASLDFDRFVMHSGRFDLPELRQMFDELHQDHSRAFRGLITDYAFTVWAPERSQ